MQLRDGYVACSLAVKRGSPLLPRVDEKLPSSSSSVFEKERFVMAVEVNARPSHVHFEEERLLDAIRRAMVTAKLSSEKMLFCLKLRTLS